MSKLVIVSNRLPIVAYRDKGDQWLFKPGSGGLVTALGPVLRDRGGLWIGWLGTTASEGLLKSMRKGEKESGYSLWSVELTRKEIEKYYHGFANEILWPLFHDIVSRCNFDPTYWDVDRRVNRKFADQIAANTDADDYVWVQDYHLALIADELKRIGVKRKTGFFLHIPFPPLDIFLKLPWRAEILLGLLEYELIGFQTMRDRRNFIQCIKTLLPGVRMSGAGQVSQAVIGSRTIRIGAFPISIDYREFETQSKSEEVARQAWIIHANLPRRQLIIGIDRLDYTKGIPNRLYALDRAFRKYPNLKRRITLVQIVVPSRTEVPEYQELRREIEELVGRINGRYTEVGWAPINYQFRSLTRTELLGYYRTSEIAMVTPLKDGMNLVAKEYCTCNIEGNGVLILSEFAGAAAQFQDYALMVNPYDIDGMADAIFQAYFMSPEERRTRMNRLRRSVQKQNILGWVNSFLKAGISRDLNDIFFCGIISSQYPSGSSMK
jgi:trehalose 6-phosphate synthase/phosphatase